jgi:hypothetical protein
VGLQTKRIDNLLRCVYNQCRAIDSTEGKPMKVETCKECHSAKVACVCAACARCGKVQRAGMMVFADKWDSNSPVVCRPAGTCTPTAKAQ